jgi:hypothetical protein
MIGLLCGKMVSAFSAASFPFAPFDGDDSPEPEETISAVTKVDMLRRLDQAPRETAATAISRSFTCSDRKRRPRFWPRMGSCL